MVVTAGAVAVAVILVLHFGLWDWLGGLPDRHQGFEEKALTLQRHQRLAGLVGTGETQAEVARAEQRLKALEAGLLESTSASLAGAEWQRLVRQLADSRDIPLTSSEFLRQEALSPEYILVLGRMQFVCRLDQLVDFMSALGSSPKLISVRRVRIRAGSGQEKKLSVEITSAAVMPAPESTGGGPEHRP